MLVKSHENSSSLTVYSRFTNISFAVVQSRIDHGVCTTQSFLRREFSSCAGKLFERRGLHDVGDASSRVGSNVSRFAATCVVGCPAKIEFPANLATPANKQAHRSTREDKSRADNISTSAMLQLHLLPVQRNYRLPVHVKRTVKTCILRCSKAFTLIKINERL